MYEVLEKGGYVMVAIVSCSILAVMIVLERWIYYRQYEKQNELFMVDIEQNIASGMAIREKDDSALARLWRNVIGSNKKMLVMPSSEVELFLANEALQMEKYLYILATIATIAPLLGLLGTVMGMIKTFHAAAAAGINNPALLAEGISEALYNTAAGLCVTIVCIISNNHYRNRIEQILQTIELRSNKIGKLIAGGKYDAA